MNTTPRIPRLASAMSTKTSRNRQTPRPARATTRNWFSRSQALRMNTTNASADHSRVSSDRSNRQNRKTAMPANSG